MSLEPNSNFLHNLNTDCCGSFFFFLAGEMKILHKFCRPVPFTKTKILPQPNHIFSSLPVRRERWSTREVWSPASGWAGIWCLQSEALGWALARSLLPPETERQRRGREREHGEGGEKNDGFREKNDFFFFYLDNVRKDFNLVFCILVDYV
jgi:hypothetical protein